MTPFPRRAVFLLSLFTLAATAARAQEENLPFKVHEAIRTGVNWLKTRQTADGDFGETKGELYSPGGDAWHERPSLCAFALYCLLKCDVPVTDPVITKGFAYLRTAEVKGVYEYAVVIMAFRELYHFTAQASVKQKFSKATNPDVESDRFMAGLKHQTAAYGISKVGGAQGQADWQYVDKLAKQLADWQNAKQGWRYGDLGGNDGPQDISATHLALFGLKAALACNVAIDKSAFAGAALYLLDAQEVDGPAVKAAPAGRQEGSWSPMAGDRARGWAYMSTSADADEKERSGGMTGAAIIGLMVCKSELSNTPFWRQHGVKVDRAINDGVAWLDAHWTPNLRSNPPSDDRTGYYWWVVERTGVLGGIQLIGAHTWYIEGATNLVAIQKPVDKDHAFWDIGQELAPTDLLNTIYALLFLKKHDHALGIPPITRGGK